MTPEELPEVDDDDRHLNDPQRTGICRKHQWEKWDGECDYCQREEIEKGVVREDFNHLAAAVLAEQIVETGSDEQGTYYQAPPDKLRAPVHIVAAAIYRESAHSWRCAIEDAEAALGRLDAAGFQVTEKDRTDD